MRPLLLALVLAGGAQAQESASFLKLGVGARAVGMGGAYTAAAQDVNALYWNPAGLGLLGRRELGFTHAELPAGTRYDSLAYAQPMKYGTMGAGAAYMGQGGIEGRDSQGHVQGDYGASDSAVSVGYGAPVKSVRLGAGVKFIQSRIASSQAQGFALDLGAMTALKAIGPGVPTIGFAIQNLGPGLKYANETSPLPLTVAFGAGYQLPVGMTLALDIRQRPNGAGTEAGMGTEYAFMPGLAFRAGYNSATGGSGGAGLLGPLSGFAAGLGLKAYGYDFDYSMTPFGELGNVQRFSLGTRFR